MFRFTIPNCIVFIQELVFRTNTIVFLYIIIILLIIRVIKTKFKIYEWQRATASGIFATVRTRLCKCATASDVFGG
jgi:hypothetical protein